MSEQIPLTSDAVADLPHPDDGTREISADLAYKRLAIVNVVFSGAPQCGTSQQPPPLYSACWAAAVPQRLLVNPALPDDAPN